MAANPDREKEDSPLPRKKAKLENEEPKITKSGQDEDQQSISSSSTEHGEEADTNPSNHQKDTLHHHGDDNNNTTTKNNGTTTPPPSKKNNTNKDTTPPSQSSPSETTSTEKQDTNIPYHHADVVWEGNCISDLSWPTIPRFESWRLRDVSEGDKDFEKELIDMFRSTTEEKLPTLQEALRTQNKDESILLSHDIKGSSSNIGAELIRLVAERIELLSRAGKFVESLECVPQLRKTLVDTNKVFDEYFAAQ